MLELLTKTSKLLCDAGTLSIGQIISISNPYVCFSCRDWADFAVCNADVDIAGPGVDIRSLATPTDVVPATARYSTTDGTSLAAAFVAGAIAKIWSRCSGCTKEQVEDCLLESTIPISLGTCAAVGLVQAEDAYICLRDTELCC